MSSNDDRETILQPGDSRPELPERVRRTLSCTVSAGPDAGRRVALSGKPVVVGAQRGSDLTLNDPSVSRKHVQLEVVADGVQVRDLGSSNGTFLNAVRINEVIVQPGAQLRLGDTTLRVQAGAPPRIEPSTRGRFGELLGSSSLMREVFAMLELAAPTDSTVLIEGESGTGKELTARALHDHSPRAGQPLVVVDCSAIAESLIESHLFGHLKGSFTGAIAERKGAFVEANRGTLFLDEIGELPLAAQAKLLRALEAQTVQPVGSNDWVCVDTRVVAATHRGLSRMVEEKTFRFDLFYRLAVVHIQLPPLRERPDDVPGLIEAFYSSRGVDAGELDCDNLRRMQAHEWSGNVRELRNVLERAWVMAGPGGAPFAELPMWLADEAEPDTPRAQVDTSLPFKDAKEKWNDAFEREYLARVFDEHGQNITHAAEHAGLTRRHMRELLRKHGLAKK